MSLEEETAKMYDLIDLIIDIDRLEDYRGWTIPIRIDKIPFKVLEKALRSCEKLTELLREEYVKRPR